MLRDLIENGPIIDVIATFVALGLVLAAILSLFFIIFGGISFILSAGQEDKIKKAVHTIRYSIIGLVICFVAFFVVQWIAKLLNIPFELQFSKVLDLMQQIFQSLSE
jgi:uncharacterized membrane protein